MIVTLMRDVLTPAEKSAAGAGRTAAVKGIRARFQEAMERDLQEAVERLTGRRVLASIGGNHVDPDIAAEVFILKSPLRPPRNEANYG